MLHICFTYDSQCFQDLARVPKGHQSHGEHVNINHKSSILCVYIYIYVYMYNVCIYVHIIYHTLRI